MRENKLMLTLTQRSLGAIPVSERRAAEMLKKVVVIAATLLAVSAGTDVPLQGSGKLETEAICWRYAASTRLLSGWPRLAP